MQVARRGNCVATWIRTVANPSVLPVDSAFNGLALYDVAHLHARNATHCRYHGRTCEHVAFHACLREKGVPIGVLPSMLVRFSCDEARWAVGSPCVPE